MIGKRTNKSEGIASVFCWGVLFLFFNLGYGQEKIKVITDTQDPIPYAHLTIKCNEKEIHAIANENGEFQKPSGCNELLVRIKALGFVTSWQKLSPNAIFIKLAPQDIVMSELVVTGQYAPESVEQSINKIKIIDSKRIQAQGAVNLQEIMEQEMNIRVSQDQFLGSSMSIQGLSGENIKILIDGVPVIGRQNGNIDLAQLNLNQVERIEIIEGPMSVSYGTNALAGTINIITKQTTEKLAASATSYLESVGQYNIHANLSTTIKKTGVDIHGGRNFFNGFSLTDSGRVQQWKPKEQLFGGVSLNRKFKQTTMSLRSDAFQEKLIVRGAPRAPYYETAFDDYYFTTRFNNQFTVDHQFKKPWNIKIVGAYNYYKREKIGFLKNLVTVENQLLDAPETRDTSVFDLYMSRGTLSYTKEEAKINAQLGYDINIEQSRGKRIENQTQQIGDYALFGSIKYKPSKKLDIQPGLRYAYNTQYTSPLVPSLNLKYQASEHLSFRSSYGRGFRSPALKELYFLFVDINHNIEGNQNLRAETSNNYMLQMTYKRGIKRGVYDFNLSGFYNNVTDQIALALIDQSTQLYSYQNVGQFYSKGINFTSGFRYKTYKTHFGYSYIGRYNIDHESNPSVNAFSYSPEILGNFIYEVNEWNTSFSLFYKYNGKLIGYQLSEFGDVTSFKIPAYSMMDASVTYLLLKKKLHLTGGVKNIFNVTNLASSVSGGIHQSNDGMTSVGWGRSYFLQIAYRFSK